MLTVVPLLCAHRPTAGSAPYSAWYPCQGVKHYFPDKWHSRLPELSEAFCGRSCAPWFRLSSVQCIRSIEQSLEFLPACFMIIASQSVFRFNVNINTDLQEEQAGCPLNWVRMSVCVCVCAWRKRVCILLFLQMLSLYAHAKLEPYSSMALADMMWRKLCHLGSSLFFNSRMVGGIRGLELHFPHISNVFIKNFLPITCNKKALKIMTTKEN